MPSSDKRAVVRAGLRALQKRDSAIEQSLKDDPVPVAASIHADPRWGIPAEQVFADLRGLHSKAAAKHGGM